MRPGDLHTLPSPRLVRPPTLRAFLDAGGDICAVDVWLDALAEAAQDVAPSLPLPERRKRIAELRVAPRHSGSSLAERVATVLPADLQGPRPE